MEEEFVGDQALEFVKPLKKITNYRQDQAELIKAALEIARDNPLNALKYIVSCLAHEGHEVEFHLVITISRDQKTQIYLAIKETDPQDELGFYVSWGDGTITHNNRYHEYEPVKENTEFNIRIFGLGITGFGDYYNERYAEYLTKVVSFGNLGHKFTSLKYAFRECNKLVSIPAVLPSSITDLSYAFDSCVNFDLPVDSWDISNVTDLSYMFSECIKFNQPLDSWNTSSVTTIHGLFYNCRSFNQPLNSWNTSKVTYMGNTFSFCYAFNQPLNSWDTSSVTNMGVMFYKCKIFNQPLDKWATHNVLDMDNMFCDCFDFNQPLNSWNVSNVKDMGHMFCNCHSFNQTLESWDIRNVLDMRAMFYECKSYEHPLNMWIINSYCIVRNMLQECALKDEYHPQIKVEP